MASLGLERVSKTYPNGQTALSDLDLEVADGEFLVLVGPSGCGKSTALRIIAGLESPTRGRVRIGGRDATELPPGKRDVAMVFQSYALYPHKTVRENLAFALRVRGLPRARREERIRRAAARLGLEALLERRPPQLSGGERQRTALGRALVREPLAFLLDEPLSNLDAKLRVETRAELARLHRELAATIVYVTHDQEEAMTLGDRIAVLQRGRLEQVGPPLEIYRHPATTFVAEFIGSPAMNWLDARLEHCAEGPELRSEGFVLRAGPALAERAAGPLRLAVRPQDLSLCAPGAGLVDATIELVQSTGAERIVHVRLAGPSAARLRVVDSGDVPLASGSAIGVALDPARVHLFDPQSGLRI